MLLVKLPLSIVWCVNCKLYSKGSRSFLKVSAGFWPFLIFSISWFCHNLENVVLVSSNFLDTLKNFVKVLIFVYFCLEERRNLIFHSKLWMNLLLFLPGKYSFFQRLDIFQGAPYSSKGTWYFAWIFPFLGKWVFFFRALQQIRENLEAWEIL